MISDSDGMTRAYAKPSGLYKDGDTLFIAGTRDLTHVREWWMIPTFKVQHSVIYRKAKEYLRKNREIVNLVGHSYGGVVALALASHNSKYHATTYSAPVFDPIPRNYLYSPNRYCNAFDPICSADQAAEKHYYIDPFNPNPHSYHNTSAHKKTRIRPTRLKSPFV